MILYTHPTYPKMIKLMLSSFPKKFKLRILDFGCGSGYLLDIFPKERIESYSGFDINKSAIEAAKKKTFSKNISFNLINEKGNLNFGKLDSYDAVIAIGVLQYMSEPEITLFLRESRRVLNKGGILLLSTVVDHLVYQIFNIYGIFLPNKFVNRKKLIKEIKKSGLKIEYQKEQGVLIGPLISHNLTIFPDSLDKIFFATKGTLGFFGSTFRRVLTLFMGLEYLIPLDYGYTLYLKARK